MASVNGLSLWNNKVTQYNMSASTTKFGNQYVLAVNYVLDQLHDDLDLDSAPTAITNTRDSIDLDVKYQTALSTGIDYWLIRFKNTSGDLNLGSAFASFDAAIRRARVRRDADIRDASDEDDGNVHEIAELDDDS